MSEPGLACTLLRVAFWGSLAVGGVPSILLIATSSRPYPPKPDPFAALEKACFRIVAACFIIGAAATALVLATDACCCGYPPAGSTSSDELRSLVEHWSVTHSRADNPPTTIAQLRNRLTAEQAARDDYARRMHATTADIKSQWTAADEVVLEPVPDRVRAIV